MNLWVNQSVWFLRLPKGKTTVSTDSGFVAQVQQDHPDWNIMLLEFGPFGLRESDVKARVIHIQSQNRSIQGVGFTW